MTRLIVTLVVLLVVLVGALFFFASRDTTKEPVRMEKVVPLENLAR